jgi:hypothetical protein
MFINTFICNYVYRQIRHNNQIVTANVTIPLNNIAIITLRHNLKKFQKFHSGLAHNNDI